MSERNDLEPKPPPPFPNPLPPPFSPSLFPLPPPLFPPHLFSLFFPERLKKSQSDQRTMHPPHPVRAKRKSRSTSAANGVDPSAPRTPGNSSIDVATARATVHDKMEPHLNLHACSALLLINEDICALTNVVSIGPLRTRGDHPPQLRSASLQDLADAPNPGRGLMFCVTRLNRVSSASQDPRPRASCSVGHVVCGHEGGSKPTTPRRLLAASAASRK